MGQTRLSISIIYIERSYVNRILQVSMDRIIDIFGKIKNRESFMRSVHVSIILSYIGLRNCFNSFVAFHYFANTTVTIP